jgi:hypothetical protein
MLLDGNTGDPGPFHALFDVTPVPFDAETLAYLRK